MLSSLAIADLLVAKSSCPVRTGQQLLGLPTTIGIIALSLISAVLVLIVDLRHLVLMALGNTGRPARTKKATANELTSSSSGTPSKQGSENESSSKMQSSPL